MSTLEKEDEQKEHDKITTEESVSYGTLDNDQDIAAKKDVSERPGMIYTVASVSLNVTIRQFLKTLLVVPCIA